MIRYVSVDSGKLVRDSTIIERYGIRRTLIAPSKWDPVSFELFL